MYRITPDEYLNKMISLEEYTFDFTRDVTHFDLHQSNIISIHTFSFASRNVENKFKYVNVLNLNLNLLVKIPARVFVNLIGLKKLFMSHNNISSIPKNSFATLTKLKDLNLNNNNIAYLPSTLFENQYNLINLNIGSNQLNALPSNLFSKLSSIENIKANRNQIVILPSGLFDNNHALKIVDLSSNQITTIYCKLFHISSYSLYLNKNRLTSLDKSIFGNAQIYSQITINVEDNVFHVSCSMSWYLRNGFKIEFKTQSSDLYSNGPLIGIRHSCVLIRYGCDQDNFEVIQRMATDCEEPG